ncbi:hypothetical protein T484DRAFT_3630378 [Baffinella frigidus]|nr:hypothetical protein T484DRAFT_3630378 [Cryptophyta sp. CCMP2293]
MSGTPEGERDASCDEAGQSSPAPDSPSEGKSHYHPRQLTAARALEIFRLRPQPKGPSQQRRGAMKHIKTIAPQFGVSTKTVREIWAGRTWGRATRQEWTEAEILSRASSFSRMMGNDSAGINSSDTTGVLQRITSYDAAADSPPDAWSIPALQHSLPVSLLAFAPPSQHQAPTLQTAPLLGLNNSALPFLQALLATAHAQQQAGLQHMQPATPQAHTSSATQLLAQFSGFQAPPPRPAWGSGAATQLAPAQDLESAMRSVQARLLQNEVHHFLQHRRQ